MRTTLFLCGLLLATPAWAQHADTARTAPPNVGPVLDMHLHAGPGSAESGYYAVRADETPDEARFRTLSNDMDRHGVVLGVLSGPAAFTTRYAAAAPGRFIAGISFPCTEGLSPNLYPCFEDGRDWPDVARLREEAEAGRLGALGELYNVYAGISPLDPRMEPYYDLAAELDLPVAVHADRGPPPAGRVPGCCPDFNGDYGSPGLYREVLERYPQLRLYLMHVINPEFVGEAIRLMDRYPNVYMDTSPMSRVPTALVHDALQRVVDAGHADRILFGSDYLGAIGESIAVIEAAPSLTEEQKRGIYYENAARFLRLQKGMPQHLPRAYVDGAGPGWRPLGETDFADVNGRPETWTWQDDLIRTTGEPIGVYCTVQDLTNFELVVSWRHLRSGGNSGVFVWVPERALVDLEPDALPQYGIEVQMLDHGYKEQYEARTGEVADWFTTNGDVFAVGESELTPFPPTSPNGARSFPRKALSRGAGAWNHYYVRGINGEVRLWVNGEEVSGGRGARPRSGRLCLEAEGAPVEFRTLRVRELP